MLAKILSSAALCSFFLLACKTIHPNDSDLSASSRTSKSRQWIQRIPLKQGQDFSLDGLYKEAHGGLIVLGKVFVPNGDGSQEEIILQGLDSAGKALWRTVLPHSPDVRMLRVSQSLQTSDGSIYVGFVRGSLQNPDQDEHVLNKMSPHGRLLWQLSLATMQTGTPDIYALGVDSKGDIIVLGTVAVQDSVGESFPQCSVTKIDAKGKQSWVRPLPEIKDCSPTDFGQTVAFDDRDDIYLSLSEAVAKLSQQGQLQWHIAARSISIQHFKNTIYSTSPQKTMALGLDGKVIWSQNSIGGLRLLVDTSGVTIGTLDYDTRTSAPSLRILKSNLTGELLWQQTYRSSPSSSLLDMTRMADGSTRILSGVSIRKDLFGGSRVVMALLGFDGSGQELPMISSQETLTAWRMLIQSDGTIYLGDIRGYLEKFKN